VEEEHRKECDEREGTERDDKEERIEHLATGTKEDRMK
jgi:hypothetical protein